MILPALLRVEGKIQKVVIGMVIGTVISGSRIRKRIRMQEKTVEAELIVSS